MAPELGHVTTGRTYVREKHTCESCKVRNKVGKPKSGEGMWAAWLHIPKHALDVLLIAAAEFDELCEEAGEYSTAVDFVDWVRPDAISKAWSSPVKVEPDPVSLEEKRRRHRAGAA